MPLVAVKTPLINYIQLFFKFQLILDIFIFFFEIRVLLNNLLHFLSTDKVYYRLELASDIEPSLLIQQKLKKAYKLIIHLYKPLILHTDKQSKNCFIHGQH